MKHTATRLFVLAGLLMTVTAIAAPTRVTTNYFPNLKVTAVSFANAGDTGLTVGTVYVCFNLADIAQCTAVQATQDVAAVVNAILYRADTAIDALAATNKPVQFTITDETQSSGATNLTVFYRVEINKNVSTFTYTSE